MFSTTIDNKELLRILKARLTDNFGELIHRIILFGSRVNGCAGEFSDYDILIITKTDNDWRMKDKIRDICYDACIEFNIIIDVKILSVEELGSIKGKQPFVEEAISHGMSL